MTLRGACTRLAEVALCLAVVTAPQPLLSHGALIEAQTAQAIRLHAFYDTGEPMSHAQVLIHAPGEPGTPWGQGVTDRQGRFEFIPDGDEGRWTVQVRQAGHGAMLQVEISDNTTVMLAPTAPADGLQRALMVALVAWGALGTALFALRKGRRDASA